MSTGKTVHYCVHFRYTLAHSNANLLCLDLPALLNRTVSSGVTRNTRATCAGAYRLSKRPNLGADLLAPSQEFGTHCSNAKSSGVLSQRCHPASIPPRSPGISRVFAVILFELLPICLPGVCDDTEG